MVYYRGILIEFRAGPGFNFLMVRIEGEVVSREDLFGRPAGSSPSSPVRAPVFEFEEVDVTGPESYAEDDALNVSEFQLFAGASTQVDLSAPKEEFRQGRPLDYYLSRSTPERHWEFAVSAVTGDAVLAEASLWQKLAAKNPLAADINQDYVPKRRKCRPGKLARAHRKAKNERLEREKKQAYERFKNRRRRR